MRSVPGPDGARSARHDPRTHKPCANCNLVPERDYLRKGRCKACDNYLRETGRERPYVTDGRSERGNRVPRSVEAFQREAAARAAAGMRPLPVPAKLAPYINPQSN